MISYVCWLHAWNWVHFTVTSRRVFKVNDLWLVFDVIQTCVRVASFQDVEESDRNGVITHFSISQIETNSQRLTLVDNNVASMSRTHTFIHIHTNPDIHLRYIASVCYKLIITTLHRPNHTVKRNVNNNNGVSRRIKLHSQCYFPMNYRHRSQLSRSSSGDRQRLRVLRHSEHAARTFGQCESRYSSAGKQKG